MFGDTNDSDLRSGINMYSDFNVLKTCIFPSLTVRKQSANYLKLSQYITCLMIFSSMWPIKQDTTHIRDEPARPESVRPEQHALG